MFRIVLTEPASPQVSAALPERVETLTVSPDGSDLADLLEAADALLVRLFPVTAEVIAQSPCLKVIGRHGVGYDTVDIAAATASGIPVVYTPQANSNAVAEHALTLMLTVARRLVDVDHTLRAGLWRTEPFVDGWELNEKTVGIVGMGQIGRRVAHLCGVGFGMTVLGYDPMLTTDQFPASVARCQRLEELLARADFVTLHALLTAETHHLMNAERLAQMKPDAILINTARGPLVDQVALAAALANGQLGGAGLDVFEEEPIRPDSPLLALDAQRVTFTPHSAALTDRAMQRMAEMVCDGILAVLDGGKPSNVVNPQVWG